MGWRILYIEEATSVRLYLDNIKIEKETNNVTIPLSDIHTLVIDNQAITITVPLILKCSEYNINIILCSIEHMPKTIIEPIFGNYQAPLILKKQIEWDLQVKGELHKLIIKNKIINQVDLLKHLNLDMNVISKMFSFYNEVCNGDVTNREGLSAKMYFRELFGVDFKRFDEDIVNAGLNYGYAILRSMISKSLIAKGLNPALGVFHKGYNNCFNLADDIIEVYRPIIDRYVYENMRDAIIFKKEDRINLVKVCSQDVIYDGECQTLLNSINLFIDRIIDIFEKKDILLYKELHLKHEL